MSARRKVCKVARPAPSAPVAGQPDPIRFFYDKVSPWVSRGAVYGFSMNEELAEPTILEYESAICALTVVSTGSVFGLTTGRRGHLFYYHPSFYVVDVGLVSDQAVAGGAVVTTEGDEIVGGWHGGDRGGLFRHNAAREFGTGQEDFHARKDPLEPVPLPARQHGITALAYSRPHRTVYGLTPQNCIVSLAAGAKKVRLALDPGRTLAPVLVALPDGTLLGAGDEGELWQWRPGSPAVERLGLYAPCEKGKRYVAGVQSLRVSASGLVYGGTATDGFFFALDPGQRSLVNLGKPHRQAFIRCLTEGHDGTIYGVVEEPQGMARLFCFDPVARGFEDLGVLNTFIPVQWAPHAIGALCTGLYGEVYLGERDSISHLFVYYPPVVRR